MVGTTTSFSKDRAATSGDHSVSLLRRTRENEVSYHSFKKKCADQATPPDRVAQESDVAARALELFGTEASTAIALCGLEAWLEGEEQEFRLWSDIFLRLHN